MKWIKKHQPKRLIAYILGSFIAMLFLMIFVERAVYVHSNFVLFDPEEKLSMKEFPNISNFTDRTPCDTKWEVIEKEDYVKLRCGMWFPDTRNYIIHKNHPDYYREVKD